MCTNCPQASPLSIYSYSSSYIPNRPVKPQPIEPKPSGRKWLPSACTSRSHCCCPPLQCPSIYYRLPVVGSCCSQTCLWSADCKKPRDNNNNNSRSTLPFCAPTSRTPESSRREPSRPIAICQQSFCCSVPKPTIRFPCPCPQRKPQRSSFTDVPQIIREPRTCSNIEFNACMLPNTTDSKCNLEKYRRMAMAGNAGINLNACPCGSANRNRDVEFVEYILNRCPSKIGKAKFLSKCPSGTSNDGYNLKKCPSITNNARFNANECLTRARNEEFHLNRYCSTNSDDAEFDIKCCQSQTSDARLNLSGCTCRPRDEGFNSNECLNTTSNAEFVHRSPSTTRNTGLKLVRCQSSTINTKSNMNDDTPSRHGDCNLNGNTTSNAEFDLDKCQNETSNSRINLNVCPSRTGNMEYNLKRCRSSASSTGLHRCRSTTGHALYA